MQKQKHESGNEKGERKNATKNNFLLQTCFRRACAEELAFKYDFSRRQQSLQTKKKNNNKNLKRIGKLENKPK